MKTDRSNFHLASLEQISVLAIISLFILGNLASLVFAPTARSTALGSSATVNSYVEVSTNVTTIPFGSVDPASQNNPSTSNPINLTNTLNSNTAIDIYFNSTNMTSGANSIPYYNLSVATGDTGTASRSLNESGYINGSAANTGYFENLSRGNSTNFYFFLDVPAGQTAGVYNGTVVIRSVADGNAP